MGFHKAGLCNSRSVLSEHSRNRNTPVEGLINDQCKMKIQQQSMHGIGHITAQPAIGHISTHTSICPKPKCSLG